MMNYEHVLDGMYRLRAFYTDESKWCKGRLGYLEEGGFWHGEDVLQAKSVCLLGALIVERLYDGIMFQSSVVDFLHECLLEKGIPLNIVTFNDSCNDFSEFSAFIDYCLNRAEELCQAQKTGALRTKSTSTQSSMVVASSS